MKSSKEIAERFREVFLNGTWVANTNYKKILEDVSWKKATQKVSNLNTILLLAFHINYYLEGILNVFEGGKLEIKDKYSFTTPEVTDENYWNTLKNNLTENAEKFAIHIEQISKEDLQKNFTDKKYGSYYRNIEGMIEHSYYHLGQISLIKKMLG